MSGKGNCYDNALMESFFGDWKSKKFTEINTGQYVNQEEIYLTISKLFITEKEAF